MKLFCKLPGLVVLICGMLFSGMLLSGCVSYQDPVFSENPEAPSSTMNGMPNNTSSPEADAARFQVGDTVIVDFSGLPTDGTSSQMPESNQSIQEDGTITLPYIGTVKAAGKTPGDLQNDIHALYVPKYFVHLTVTVKSDNRVFYVGGEVKQPGRQLYVGVTTVTKAIQAAGDFTDFANRNKVWLIRADGDRIKVNCTKALEDPSQDMPVYPGDQVQVPRRIF